MGEGDQGCSAVFEPPDVCVWTLVGDVGLKTMTELYAEQERIAKGRPYVLVLVDVSGMASVSSEARAEAARRRDVMVQRGVAFVGASFHLRVLATLVSRAANLLNNIRDNPTRFCATKAEAFAWFEERRREIARGAKPPGDVK
jgi:hypothetical protein